MMWPRKVRLLKSEVCWRVWGFDVQHFEHIVMR